MKLLLFVCHGNAFRSPLLAALVKKRFADHLRINVDAESAGTKERDPSPPSANARIVASEYGVDIRDHISRHVKDVPQIRQFLLFYCMEDEQKQALVALGIEPSKIVTLHIPDPFPSGLEVYRECARQLEALVPKIFNDTLALAREDYR